MIRSRGWEPRDRNIAVADCFHLLSQRHDKVKSEEERKFVSIPTVSYLVDLPFVSKIVKLLVNGLEKHEHLRRISGGTPGSEVGNISKHWNVKRKMKLEVHGAHLKRNVVFVR